MNDNRNSKKNPSVKGKNKDFFNLLSNNLINAKNNQPPNNKDTPRTKNEREQIINVKGKKLSEHFSNNHIEEVKSPHFFQEKGGQQEDKNSEKIEPTLNQSNSSSLKNLFGGIKQSPNITEINKVMIKSQELLKEQKIILENFSQVNQKLATSENEIQNFNSKNESDDISNFMEKYSDSMKLLVEKLLGHAEEVEKIKCNNKNVFLN